MRYVIFVAVLLLTNGALHFGLIGGLIAAAAWAGYWYAYHRKAAQTAEPTE